MGVLHYKDPVTGEWLPIVSGPKGPKGDKGDTGESGGITGPPGAPGATTHSALTDLGLHNDDHTQYLKAEGDTLEGGLEIIGDVAELTFLIHGVKKFGIRSSEIGDSLKILRYTSPTMLDRMVEFTNSSGNMWIGDQNQTLDIEMALRVLHTAIFSQRPTFTLGADMTNDKIINVATPTADTDAANKAYVDTLNVGGIYNMSGSIPTGTAAHWLNGVGSPHVWGGMSSGADHLLVQKNGYYRCSFNATYSTNVTGIVREVRLAVSGGDQTGIPANSFHIGATATPNSWGGWGLNLSASGIWHLNVGNGIRIMARHDSGANLFCSGTLTMELVDLA